MRASTRLARGLVAASVCVATIVAGSAGAVATTSPDPGEFNQLFGVEAISPTDVWAVGRYTAPTGQGRTLALHWNGATWTRVWSPSPYDAELSDVSATSPTDVWAVGSFLGPRGIRTLAIHWDGLRWTRVPTPNPSGTHDILHGVAAISPTDAWAVGSFTNADRKSQTLALHWNGVAWRRVWSPHPSGRGSALRGVSANASDDVWAVGSYTLQGSWGLVLRWNGTAWVKAFARRGQLNAVSAAGPNDVWAVGELGLTRGVTLHFDGAGWADVVPPASAKSLYGVAAVGPGDAWAVGSVGDDTQTVAIHWNGAAWSVATTPSPGDLTNELFDVSAMSSSDVYAVGRFEATFGGASRRHTLAIRWDGEGWFRI